MQSTVVLKPARIYRITNARRTSIGMQRLAEDGCLRPTGTSFFEDTNVSSLKDVRQLHANPYLQDFHRVCELVDSPVEDCRQWTYRRSAGGGCEQRSILRIRQVCVPFSAYEKQLLLRT